MPGSSVAPADSPQTRWRCPPRSRHRTAAARPACTARGLASRPRQDGRRRPPGCGRSRRLRRTWP
eukprot:15471793-Alexandrium_andersonii.AAC.1